MDPRVAKWKRWVDGTIESNVLTMHLHRHAWQEVAAILQAHGDLPDSYWWEFMRDTYATTQAIAVRRQADTHRDAASLGKLIEEISGDPSKFTRDFYMGLWNDSDTYWLGVGQRHWQETYSGDVVFSSSAFAQLVPAIQHDWKAAFTVPWIKPRGLSLGP